MKILFRERYHHLSQEITLNTDFFDEADKEEARQLMCYFNRFENIILNDEDDLRNGVRYQIKMWNEEQNVSLDFFESKDLSPEISDILEFVRYLVDKFDGK